MLATCLYFFISFFGFQSSVGEGWKGLVPLHSTRADVERLLGPSKEKCNCFYETEREKIFVHYSDGPCIGFLHGWNVAKDTVLMLTVRSNNEVDLADLSLDLTKYAKTQDSDTPDFYFTNIDAGVRYAVRETGIVDSIHYIPKRADYSLRCDGFPSTPDLGYREFKPFDTYSSISLADEYARLDNFSIWLHDQPEMKGYILVYASKKIPASKARMRAQNAKKYLVERRNIESRRINVIEGGYREQFQVELYILPRTGKPPIAYPTLVPLESNVNKNDNRRASKARFKRGKRSSLKASERLPNTNCS